MTKEKITTKNFVVNCNWDGDLEVWFVRHTHLDKGKPMIVGVGYLEKFLIDMREKLLSERGEENERGQSKETKNSG